MRTVLLVGFGLTFGIWLFAGNYFLRRMGDIESRTAAVNVRYMQAQELLSDVRGGVLLASLSVRDALLDPKPNTAEYRRQVDEAFGAATQSLSQYVPVLDATEERERVERLRALIEEFRVTIIDVLATDSSRWPAEARELLRTMVVPKRQMVIRLSEAVQSLNRAAFVQQQREVATIYAANQRQLWQTLGVALVASFGVAALVALYAGRLQRRLQQQRSKESQNARELQDLSAKLITAQEEERRSIARELHDEVGQALTAIKVELAVAERGPEGDRRTAALQDARSIAEGALTAVRDLSHLLRPALLDDLGLAAAVEWFLRGFSRRHEVRTEFAQRGLEERLAPEIEVAAYRVVQEALTNVGRHARASTCRVSLERDGSTLRLTIEDDGIGFEEAGVATGAARPRLGLIGIRERASQLGGDAHVRSVPGQGTTLVVELPARARHAPDPSVTARGSLATDAPATMALTDV
jgi:signal transduction histidine kinase